MQAENEQLRKIQRDFEKYPGKLFFHYSDFFQLPGLMFVALPDLHAQLEALKVELSRREQNRRREISKSSAKLVADAEISTTKTESESDQNAGLASESD